MADINAGPMIRFDNGGKISVGGSNVLLIDSGTLRWTTPRREVYQQMDRGALGVLIPGNQRPSELEFAIKVAPNQATGSVQAALKQTIAADGTISTVEIIVDVYDGLNVVTGTKYTFTKCYAPDGEEFDFTNPEYGVTRFRLLDNAVEPTAADF